MTAGEAHIVTMHGTFALDRACYRRDVNLVAIVTDAHARLLGPVDPLDAFQKAMHEMDAGLLAIGDDVDAGVFLLFEPDQSRVALAASQRFAFQAPRRPQLLRFCEP